MLITSSNPALNISRARPAVSSAASSAAAAPEASDNFTFSGSIEEKPKSFLSKNLMGIVGGAIGVAGGAALGMSGGVLGAIAGAAAAPVLGVVGAAVGGAAAGKAFIHAFGYRAEKDGTSWYPTNTIGVLIGTIAAAGAGIALGGIGGFVGGAALGLAGGPEFDSWRPFLGTGPERHPHKTWLCARQSRQDRPKSVGTMKRGLSFLRVAWCL